MQPELGEVECQNKFAVNHLIGVRGDSCHRQRLERQKMASIPQSVFRRN